MLDRRRFLRSVPVVAGAATTLSCVRNADSTAGASGSREAETDAWEKVRGEFAISPDVVDFAALLIASHPRPVREAIERHRRGLDADPTRYLEDEIGTRRSNTLAAASRYLGAREEDIALTDSTTMGIGLVYNGFRLLPGEEFLRTDHGYYSSKEALRLSAMRTGARVRSVQLYDESHNVTADQLTGNLMKGITDQTRVVALTWVHSSTGVKLPVRMMCDAIAEVNQRRPERERIAVCVDGVHGFGIEDVEMADLGCDFFMAGCHKWLFGPRGTGIVWGNEAAWRRVIPTVPSFRANSLRQSWMIGQEPSGPATGASMSPGGFKSFEHLWAMADAFEFHLGIGKGKVAARTHELNSQLKEGLAEMAHVKLYTPMSPELSAGIVCFDVNGMSQQAVVERLREKNIIATSTPYWPSYARLTPSIRNTPAEIGAVLREIRAMA
jgi:isopenicillin-N epimerase